MKFNPSTTEAKLLTLDGLPPYLLRERPVKLDDLVSNYVSSTDGLKPLPMKKADQLNDARHVMREPTHAPYLMCVSSEPNDLKAKYFAACVALEARRQHKKVVWHTLLGSFRDELRDKPNVHGNTDLLILSNVPYGSTDVKFEKLRDILEIYSHIPRIVVTTGTEPVKLFNELGLPLNYSLWIRSTRCIRVLGN